MSTKVPPVNSDLMPEFVEHAAGRFPLLPGVVFILGDFSNTGPPPSDYVLSSGALGYKTGNPDYYFRTIERLFESARKAMGFNMLDKDKFPDHPLLVGHDKTAVLTFCR